MAGRAPAPYIVPAPRPPHADHNTLRNKLRILQVHPALYLSPLLARGFRELGHKADTVYFGLRGRGNDLTGEPDFSLPSKWWALPAHLSFLGYAMARYDVFHFWAQPHLVPPLFNVLTQHYPLDLATLKAAGKKIVWQSDGCFTMIRPSVWKTSIDPEVCFVCQTTQGDTYGHCSNNNTIHLNAAMARYADLKFGIGINLDFEADAEFVFPPVDVDLWNPDIEIPPEYHYPRRSANTVLIYHSVGSHVIGNRGNIKGTIWIHEAVRELQEEGYDVEIMHIEGLPHRTVRFYQAQADIVVDQLLIGGGGQASRECLALGKPVLVRIHPQQAESHKKASSPHPPPPYVPTDRHNVKENIRRLIVDTELRTRLGEESLQFARNVLAPRAAAARYVEHYRRLF